MTFDTPSSIDLTGRVAIVTGGGQGIGRAIAQSLAAAGAGVAVVARTRERIQETVDMICSAGHRSIALAGDVTDPNAVDEIAARVLAELGPVDLLVNNAGSAAAIGPVWEVDPREWWRDVEVNLRGPFLFCRAILPGMIGRGSGRIVNLSTYVANGPATYLSSYACSKTALLRLTDTLAAETRQHGISVFAVSPGRVRTAMTEHVIESAAGKKFLPQVAALPAEAYLPPERAATLVVKLATGVADRLSGRFLHVQDDLEALIQRTDEIEQSDSYALRLRK